MDYLEKGTKFDVKNFFNGDIEGFGILQDSDGKIKGTKTVKISSKWEGDKGVMQQNWISSDGTKESRTWLITLGSDGLFSAVGHDVISPRSEEHTSELQSQR